MTSSALYENFIVELFLQSGNYNILPVVAEHKGMPFLTPVIFALFEKCQGMTCFKKVFDYAMTFQQLQFWD